MDDINEYSDLTVSYEDKKTGRKITHFTFTFALKIRTETKDQAPEQPTVEPENKPKTA